MTSQTVIQEQDIKYYKLLTPGQFDASGGPMTWDAIDPAAANEIFDDVPPSEQTRGKVDMAGVAVAVDTLDAEIFRGGHVILTKPSANPAEVVTLFCSGEHYDTLADWRDYVARQIVPSGELRWILYGQHYGGAFEGQTFLHLYSIGSTTNGAEVPDKSPGIGDVIALVTGGDEQYLKVDKLLNRYVLKFTDSQGDYYKTIVDIEVSTHLTANYAGVENPLRASQSPSATKVKGTQYVGASHYKGIKPLALSASAGARSVKVADPYTQLAPSSQAEEPIANARAAGDIVQYAQAGAAGALSVTATLTGSTGPSYSATIHLGTVYLPGSLALSIGGASYKDDGAGNVIPSSGAAAYEGVADYAGRQVTISKAQAWSASVTATATPAAQARAPAFTRLTKVTAATRLLNYPANLSPHPAPGSVSVDYSIIGKWYRMTDDGLGRFVREGGAKAGNLSYSTGAVIESLPDYPDVDSAVITSWASPIVATMRAGSVSVPPFSVEITLAHRGIGTYSVSWPAGGATKIATADSAGNLSGDGTGRLLRGAGRAILFPAVLPDPGGQFASAYAYGVSAQQISVAETLGASAGARIFSTSSYIDKQLGVDALRPGSVHIQYPLTRYEAMTGRSVSGMVDLIDDGAGKLKISGGVGANVGATLADSMVDYANRRVYFQPVLVCAEQYDYVDYVWGPAGVTEVRRLTATKDFCFISGNAIVYDWVAAGSEDQTVAGETVACPPIKIDLTPLVGDVCLPGGVRFTLGGWTYCDVVGGGLVVNPSPTTGSGQAGGSFDYSTGVATLSYWHGAAPPAFSLVALATAVGNLTAASVAGRVDATTLAPGTFALRGTTPDGRELALGSDTIGNLTGGGKGSINFANCIYQADFGAWLAEAHASWAGSPVAFADAEANPQNPLLHFRPDPVLASSLVYDANALVTRSVDASLLGIAAERLRQDGRELCINKDDLVVVHRTPIVTLPTPLSAGQIVNLGHERLAWVKLFDASASPREVPSTEWGVNLDAGVIAMASALAVSGYVQPFSAHCRIEDQAIAIAVNPSGLVEISPQLTHDYPAGDSYLSSALNLPDLQGRVTLLFEQQVWGPFVGQGVSQWSDARQGAEPNWSYDRQWSPIVFNRGSIWERWAIVFRSTTAFDVYGEHVGQINSGVTTADYSAFNIRTGYAYFSIPHQAWGNGGQAAGHVLRMNTAGANWRVMFLRCTMPGATGQSQDSFSYELRGASNRV